MNIIGNVNYLKGLYREYATKSKCIKDTLESIHKMLVELKDENAVLVERMLEDLDK